MSFFKPSDYTLENALRESARYNGGIFVGDNHVIKDHGEYAEINIDADNEDGHDSYDYNWDTNTWSKHR
ncbi:MAG: hypothetical protein IKM73_08105 [Acidaminococcaceae bacterium]|nr:hypothetical protein [Acidaminococcaceae bacterium]